MSIFLKSIASKLHILKLTSLILGSIAIAIATPSSQAATFPAQHSKNIHNRDRQIAQTQSFEYYTGDPENREETLVGIREDVNEYEPSKEKKEAKSYYDRGKNSAASGDLQAAIADFDRAIKLKPQYALAYFNRGRAKYRLDDKQGARADYNSAIDISSTYAEAYRQRGIVQTELGNKEGAIYSFDRAIGINPEYTNAYFNRGSVKLDLGDNKGAISDYDNVIRLNPQNANAYYNRSSAKSALGDKEGTIADLRQAAKLYRSQANDTDLQDALDRLKKLGATE